MSKISRQVLVKRTFVGGAGDLLLAVALVSSLILSSSLLARAADEESIVQFAQRYYGNCLKQDHPALEGRTLEALCSCTSKQIVDHMTIGQMHVLHEDSEEGRVQRDRWLLQGYAPCIEYPTHAVVQKNCLENTEVRSSMRQYVKVCECLADGLAEFAKLQAPEHIAASLRANGKTLDPLFEFMNSKEFEMASQANMRSCVSEHEFGVVPN